MKSEGGEIFHLADLVLWNRLYKEDAIRMIQDKLNTMLTLIRKTQQGPRRVPYSKKKKCQVRSYLEFNFTPNRESGMKCYQKQTKRVVEIH